MKAKPFIFLGPKIKQTNTHTPFIILQFSLISKQFFIVGNKKSSHKVKQNWNSSLWGDITHKCMQVHKLFFFPKKNIRGYGEIWRWSHTNTHSDFHEEQICIFISWRLSGQIDRFVKAVNPLLQSFFVTMRSQKPNVFITNSAKWTPKSFIWAEYSGCL